MTNHSALSVLVHMLQEAIVVHNKFLDPAAQVIHPSGTWSLAKSTQKLPESIIYQNYGIKEVNM